MSTEGSAGWVRDRTEAKEAEEKTARPLLCEERPVSLPRCAIGRCEKRCSDLASHRSSPRGTGGRKTRGCGAGRDPEGKQKRRRKRCPAGHNSI